MAMRPSISVFVGLVVMLAACGGRVPMGTVAGGGGVMDTVASGGGVMGTGGASTGGGASPTRGTLASPLPPEKCEPIPQLPAGAVPVCTYAGGKPGRSRGCSQFPVSVFMDSGGYYFVTNDGPGVVQCPRDKDESAVLLSTGTYTGAVQDHLSGEVLGNGLIYFYCRTTEPNGPGTSNTVLCSDTGIQIIPPDKGWSSYCLEFPDLVMASGAAAYLGCLSIFDLESPSDCHDFSIHYTSLLSSLSSLPPELGAQPVTCSVDNGNMTLSFRDLSGHLVTIVWRGDGIFGISSVQWQLDNGPLSGPQNPDSSSGNGCCGATTEPSSDLSGGSGTTTGTGETSNVPGALAVLAGAPDSNGSADGTGVAARFARPTGVAVDGLGNVFVADSYNNTIRKITLAGATTTLAGTAGLSGSEDGTGATARFASPTGVAVDGLGNVFIADSENNTIRKITLAGATTTLAGTAGLSGSEDGTGAAARFDSPSGVAVDGSGNVFVADSDNNTIRKISPAGAVTTLAGTAGTSGSEDGTGATARFARPTGVAVDGSGNVFVADFYNDTIRKISSDGAVTTLAGKARSSGSQEGMGGAARFSHPYGVAADGSGNVLVADSYNNTIRKIAPAGAVTTLAGTANAYGCADGTGVVARFRFPKGVAVDRSGSVFVADDGNNTIRKITPSGAVTTLAGRARSSGSADGTGPAALFASPNGVAVDGLGNVFVADDGNHTIRKITPSGAVTTLAGTAGLSGSADGTGAAARFDSLAGVAVDGSGNVFVADDGNHTIRKITPSGAVTTLAGTAGLSGSADGTGAAARFDSPSGVAVDGSGNVFVADTYNNTIRKITPSGVVTTFTGTAKSSGSADGTGAAARFAFPSGVAVDGSGNVFVADAGNGTVRKITPSREVSTIVGNAATTPADTVPGPLPASLSWSYGVAVGPTGSIYITVDAAVMVANL